MTSENRPIDESSAKNIVQLSPSNTVDFANRPRGIIVKTDGAVAFVNDDDSVTVVPGGILAVGIVYPLAPKRINATSTTAVLYGVY